MKNEKGVLYDENNKHTALRGKVDFMYLIMHGEGDIEELLTSPENLEDYLAFYFNHDKLIVDFDLVKDYLESNPKFQEYLKSQNNFRDASSYTYAFCRALTDEAEKRLPKTGGFSMLLRSGEGKESFPIIDELDRKAYLELIDSSLLTNYSKLYDEYEREKLFQNGDTTLAQEDLKSTEQVPDERENQESSLTGAQQILNFMDANGLDNNDLAQALVMSLARVQDRNEAEKHISNTIIAEKDITDKDKIQGE